MSDDYARVGEERVESLASRYETHDTATQWLAAKLMRHGYETESLGIDKRHETVEDPSVRPDRRVVTDGEVRAYLEPKSKSLEYANWFGRLNYRHFDEYLDFANEVDVPVICYFAVVDGDDMVVREDFCPVYSKDQIVDTMVPNSNPNKVVELDERDMRSWPWLLDRLSPTQS